VINVLTVHWQSSQWINLQLGHLERNVAAPFRVYASLNGIEGDEWFGRFHFAEDLPGGHPAKLNALTEKVMEEPGTEPDDVLVFLDGDAFPVAPLVPWIDETLGRHRLAAVQRVENAKDMRPHPCFCATTVGFWREIGGDWRSRRWTSETGHEFVDAGGVLYDQLRERHVDWLAMHRTNTTDLHPLWFAVYDHRIYHHGAGFRSRFSHADRENLRVDARAARSGEGPPSLGALTVAVRKDPSKVLRLRPRHVRALGRSAIKTTRRLVTKRYERRAESVSEEVFGRLSADDTIFRELDDSIVT
jgi:hypothetical protein